MFIPRWSCYISPSPYHPARHMGWVRPATLPKERKVISIPVRFVGSDESPAKKTAMDPEVATVKVQKVFRGFLVRKNVKMVRGVEAEVGKIEEKIEGGRELIRKEEKERLRLSEMLMTVLFKLDSVHGVRGYRKKVVRRAVLLQEALDSIAEADSGKVEIGPGEKTKAGTMEKERARPANLDSEETADASSGESSVPEEEIHATATKIRAPAETLEADGDKEDAMMEGMQEEATTVDGVGSGEGALAATNQRKNALAVDPPETTAAVRRSSSCCGSTPEVLAID